MVISGLPTGATHNVTLEPRGKERCLIAAKALLSAIDGLEGALRMRSRLFFGEQIHQKVRPRPRRARSCGEMARRIRACRPRRIRTSRGSVVSHVLDTNSFIDHLRRGPASNVTSKMVAAPLWKSELPESAFNPALKEDGASTVAGDFHWRKCNLGTGVLRRSQRSLEIFNEHIRPHHGLFCLA